MKTKKRLLGILLSFVMVLGLMPGMSLTAYAVEPSVTFTEPGTQNGITVSASFYHANSNAFYVDNEERVSISSSGYPITRIVLTDAEIYHNRWGSSYLSASAGTVSFDGSTMTVTDINETSVNIIGTSTNYGTIRSIVVYYNTHTHSFTNYSASGATITATCTADGCTLPERVRTDKGNLDYIKDHAKAMGETMGEFVNRAIMEAIYRDRGEILIETVHSDEYDISGRLLLSEDDHYEIDFIIEGVRRIKKLDEQKDVPSSFISDYAWMSLENEYENELLGGE